MTVRDAPDLARPVPAARQKSVADAPGDGAFARRIRGAPAQPGLPLPDGPRQRPGPGPAPTRAASAGEIETELARLVRAGAPTRRVLCALAARAAALRSASRLGFARRSDEARERHGLSARSLQELARVHRVLARTPALDRAFLGGTIGWAGLRALARLERLEDPSHWLRLAEVLPARELERAARTSADAAEVCESPDPGATAEPAEAEDTCVPVVCARRVRAKWALGRELARRVAGARLPRWECAEVLAAEVSSAVPPGAAAPCDLDEAVDGGASLADRAAGQWALAGQPEDSAPAEAGSVGRAGSRGLPPRQPELPPALAGLLGGLETADAFEVDRRLQQAVAWERTHEARIGPLLRRVVEGRLYRQRGYWDRDRYLEQRLGLCPRKARALVRIERVVARAPALARAYRSGGLTWVQMQALAPLVETRLGRQHVAAWIGRARAVTVRCLQDDVRAALAMADLDAERFARTGGLAEAESEGPAEGEAEGEGEGEGARAERRIGASHLTDSRREDVTVSFFAPAESARFFRAVLCEVREQLAHGRGTPASEGEAFEAMLDHAITAWIARDARTRRDHSIFERDGWRCAVPGCTSHRHLQVHHVVFRSQGGGNEAENLITLCAWHHQRGVHGGLVRITGLAPDRLRFELGLRRGHPPLVVYESGDRIVP